MEAAKAGGKEERREKGAEYSTELECIIIYTVFQLKIGKTKSDNRGFFAPRIFRRMNIFSYLFCILKVDTNINTGFLELSPTLLLALKSIQYRNLTVKLMHVDLNQAKGAEG